jgi:probable addiction module antidote protein
MAVKTYPVDIAQELKTEKEIEGFIDAAIEEAKNDTDPKYLVHAFETAARARGMHKTAKEAEVDRQISYDMLK